MTLDMSQYVVLTCAKCQTTFLVPPDDERVTGRDSREPLCPIHHQERLFAALASGGA